MPEESVDITRTSIDLQPPSIRATGRPREPHRIPTDPVTTLDDTRRQIAQQEALATPEQGGELKLRFADARPPKETPTGFRRVLDTVKKVLGEVSVHDEIIPTEDMDERTIAYLILTMQQNHIRDADSRINPFNAADIMRDAGYINPDPENADYEGKWPVQYSRAHQVLRSLHEIQAIEYLSPKTAESEPDPGYTFKPEQLGLLRQLATRAAEVSPRFMTSALPPIRG